jgi:RNA polymerase sigma-70 factor (ECF subfamily)
LFFGNKTLARLVYTLAGEDLQITSAPTTDEKRRRFEAQMLPHLDAAYNLARWLARSPADAEDVVQDAMLRAYRGFDGFRGDDAKPWLLAIVRNCFITTMQRRKRHVELPGDDTAEDRAFIDEAPDPEQSAIRANDRRKLNLLMACMPADFREVLVLREMEDLSYLDIARITGVPIGTVMSRLARARALLKEQWFANVEGVRNGVQ